MDKQVAMLAFAEHLTLDPATITLDHHEELRSHGWQDADIVDMVHIVSLYSYMVRVADGLGVELEPGRGWEPLADRLPFKESSTPKEFRMIESISAATD
jgi:uncharacterized protein YciW